MKICKKSGCFGEPIGDYCEKHNKSKRTVIATEKKKISKPKDAKFKTDVQTFQNIVRAIGEGTCITCGHVFSPADRDGTCHAGHCIQRGRKWLVMMFINCHTQCASCNNEQHNNNSDVVIAHGNFINRKYAKFMRELANENKVFDDMTATELLQKMSVPVKYIPVGYRRDMKEILIEGKKMLKEGWNKNDIRNELIQKQKKFILEFFEK